MKKLLFSILISLVVMGSVFAATTNFSDVDTTDWFYPGVNYVSENGLMIGYNDGTFKPGNFINRAEFATVMDRMDAAHVIRMFEELNALRLFDITQLKGSSWETYRNVRVRYPVAGIEGAGEGTVTFASLENELEVLAEDDIFELLSISTESGVFFIRENSELGTKIYGPFYDDVARIVSEI